MQETEENQLLYDSAEIFTEILPTEPDIEAMICFTDVIEDVEATHDNAEIFHHWIAEGSQNKSGSVLACSFSEVKMTQNAAMIGKEDAKGEITKDAVSTSVDLSKTFHSSPNTADSIVPSIIHPGTNPGEDKTTHIDGNTNFEAASPAKSVSEKQTAVARYRLVQLERKQQFGDGGKKAGIGVILEKSMDELYIFHILFQSPAAQSGLISMGDGLKEIDGIKTQGMAVRDAMMLLYGIEGSMVSLLIHRNQNNGWTQSPERSAQELNAQQWTEQELHSLSYSPQNGTVVQRNIPVSPASKTRHDHRNGKTDAQSSSMMTQGIVSMFSPSSTVGDVEKSANNETHSNQLALKHQSMHESKFELATLSVSKFPAQSQHELSCQAIQQSNVTHAWTLGSGLPSTPRNAYQTQMPIVDPSFEQMRREAHLNTQDHNAAPFGGTVDSSPLKDLIFSTPKSSSTVGRSRAIERHLDQAFDRTSPDTLEDIDQAIQNEREMMKSLLLEVDSKLMALGITVSDVHAGEEASIQLAATSTTYHSIGQNDQNNIGAFDKRNNRSSFGAPDSFHSELGKSSQWQRKGCLRRNHTQKRGKSIDSTDFRPTPRFRRNILGAALAPTMEVLRPGYQSCYSPATVTTPHGEMMVSEEGPIPCALHPFIQAQAAAWQLVNAMPALVSKPVEVVHALVLEYELGRKSPSALMEELRSNEATLQKDGTEEDSSNASMPKEPKMIRWDPTVNEERPVSHRRSHQEDEPALLQSPQYPFIAVQLPGSPHLSSRPANPSRITPGPAQTVSPMRKQLTPLHQQLVTQAAVRSPMHESSVQFHSRRPASIQLDKPLVNSPVRSPQRTSNLHNPSRPPMSPQSDKPVGGLVKRSPSRDVQRPHSVGQPHLTGMQVIMIQTQLQGTSAPPFQSNQVVQNGSRNNESPITLSDPNAKVSTISPKTLQNGPEQQRPTGSEQQRPTGAKESDFRPGASTPTSTTRTSRAQVLATADF